MKDIKYFVIIGILVVGIVFLFLDRLGSTRKYDELQGTYEVYRAISKAVLQKATQAIEEQQVEIEKLDENIKWLHGIISVKDEELAEIEEDLGELKRDFASLEECQVQYNKLVEGFSLCKSISSDKDDVIFSLNEKYKSQLVVSNEYQNMYESVQGLVDIRTKQIKVLEGINKRLRLFSNVKTGIAIGLAGLIIFNMLK